MTEQKKKTIKRVVNIVLWVFLVLALIMTIWAFIAQASSNGMPNVGGRVFMPVKTPSMKGPDGFDKGELIVSRLLSDDEKQALAVGDVITFYADLDGDGERELNTHRIIEVLPADGGAVSYRTKGDNNPMADANPVRWSDVETKWTGTHIPVLGAVINFLQSQTGFLICIVIPLFLFFVYEVVVLVMTIQKIRNRGKRQITKEDEELIKQRAVEEYLRRQAEIDARHKDAPVEDAPAEAAPAEAAPTEAAPAEAAPAEESAPKGEEPSAQQ